METTLSSASDQAVRASYAVGISRIPCIHAGAQLTAVSLLTAMHPVREKALQKLSSSDTEEISLHSTPSLTTFSPCLFWSHV